MEPIVIITLLVLVLSIVGAIAYFARSTLTTKADTILIVGTIGAGKTALYYRLKGWFQNSVTSMDENIGEFTPSALQEEGVEQKPLRYIDFPGHRSKRGALDQYLASTRAVIFVIDSSESSSFTDAGQYLHSLLSSPILNSRRTPFLLAFNKSDVSGHTPSYKLEARLESELDTFRKSQTTLSTISDSDGKSLQPVFIGDRSTEFAFDQLLSRPTPVTTTEISAQNDDIGGVIEFLRKV